MLASQKAVDLNQLVQGGQLYYVFPCSKGSLAYLCSHSLLEAQALQMPGLGWENDWLMKWQVDEMIQHLNLNRHTGQRQSTLI